MSSESEREWTDDNFEQISWHDNHVHGLTIEEAADGTGILTLDLDHIVEWIRADDTFSFRVAPATLTFTGVSRLRIEIDYIAVTAGIVPFSIGAIARERLSYPNGCSSFRWTIDINWPEGEIVFEAPTFHQVLRAAPILSETITLKPKQRATEQPSSAA